VRERQVSSEEGTSLMVKIRRGALIVGHEEEGCGGMMFLGCKKR